MQKLQRKKQINELNKEVKGVRCSPTAIKTANFAHIKKQRDMAKHTYGATFFEKCKTNFHKPNRDIQLFCAAGN